MTDTLLIGMTGFGRSGGEAEWGSWTWEAKAVNGRGLDVRVNVPHGFEGLDQVVKTQAGSMFSRGNMQVSLRIEVSADTVVSVNEAALDGLCAAFKARTGKAPQGDALATLMTSRAVLDGAGGSGNSLRQMGQDKDVHKALLEGAVEALEQLAMSRANEGSALHLILSQALDEMDRTRKEAEVVSAEQPVLLKERLSLKLQEIAVEQELDSERLAAEAAFAAAKADVREELDRLEAHIETARKHLAAGQTVGRKLDFLAQELNREANTLCAKSASVPLTNAGLALKTLIDQFKEQAANVE